MSANEKSTVRSIVLNEDRLSRAAGKGFHDEITRTEKEWDEHLQLQTSIADITTFCTYQSVSRFTGNHGNHVTMDTATAVRLVANLHDRPRCAFRLVRDIS